jgi:hydrogenase/urease accessory protein HupE
VQPPIRQPASGDCNSKTHGRMTRAPSMSNKRYIFILAAVLLLGIFPLLVLQPNGAANAGISAGFRLPLDSFPLLLLWAALGLWAALLPPEGTSILPLGFLLLVFVAAVLSLGVDQFPPLRYFLLGAILSFAFLVGMTRHKVTILSMMIASSVGFHYGLTLGGAVPEGAAPLYFLLGAMLALAMILAIAVAFGVTLFSDHASWIERSKTTRIGRVLCAFFR